VTREPQKHVAQLVTRTPEVGRVRNPAQHLRRRSAVPDAFTRYGNSPFHGAAERTELVATLWVTGWVGPVPQ